VCWRGMAALRQGTPRPSSFWPLPLLPSALCLKVILKHVVRAKVGAKAIRACFPHFSCLRTTFHAHVCTGAAAHDLHRFPHLDLTILVEPQSWGAASHFSVLREVEFAVACSALLSTNPALSFGQLPERTRQAGPKCKMGVREHGGRSIKSAQQAQKQGWAVLGQGLPAHSLA